MENGFAIDVRYFRLSEELQPYFTALYSFTIACADGELVEDRLHPEWAAMRFTAYGNPPLAAIVDGAIAPTWPFVASGPTSRAIRFGLTASRIWGLGLHPAGWAKYMPVEAGVLADTIVNAGRHEAFARFAPLLEVVRGDGADEDDTARQIDAFLLGLRNSPVPKEDLVIACQEALRDPEMSDVGQLSEALGINRRSLERLCRRFFGFPPKLLLRRQRFLRSLARFMLERKHNWSKALDGQYFDQAHFVRDFRSFMGMTPSEYADAPHPILDRIIAQRMADQGAAPQTDLPTILRYATEPAAAD